MMQQDPNNFFITMCNLLKCNLLKKESPKDEVRIFCAIFLRKNLSNLSEINAN